jgi:hypothetical protein
MSLLSKIKPQYLVDRQEKNEYILKYLDLKGNPCENPVRILWKKKKARTIYFLFAKRK